MLIYSNNSLCKAAFRTHSTALTSLAVNIKMNANPNFAKWCLGYSGCDGGDIGTTQSRSIWACGLEWGGGHDPKQLALSIDKDDVAVPPRGYDDWQENIRYIFNWQLMKLLAVVEGGKVGEYKRFAESTAPFLIGNRGYFKMNLFPIGFKNTNQVHWREAFSEITGFENKDSYLQWCRQYRLPQLKTWSETHHPEIVICLGKTYQSDFVTAFLETGQDIEHEVIDNRDLYWSVNSHRTLVVILPFMVNRNGLVKNTSIQQFGERISELRLLTNCSMHDRV